MEIKRDENMSDRKASKWEEKALKISRIGKPTNGKRKR